MKHLVFAILLCTAGCTTRSPQRAITQADMAGSWEGVRHDNRYVRLDINPGAESFAYQMYGEREPSYYKLEWIERQCGFDPRLWFFMTPSDPKDVMQYCCNIEDVGFGSYRLTMAYMDGHSTIDIRPITDRLFAQRAKAEAHLKEMKAEQSGPAYPPQGVGSADP